MAKLIRFAVCGASGIAQSHIKAIQSNPNSEVVCLYSRDKSRGEKLAKTFSIKPTTDLNSILSDETIDAVDIVTEPKRHCELAQQALKHGKHVLIEKPVSTDLNEASELLTLSKNSKKNVGVISQKRFEPEIQKLKTELESGKMGKPYLIEAKLMWNRSNEYYMKGDGWRGKYGSVLINQAIHWIDITQWFFGKPTKVFSLNTTVKPDINCYDTSVCLIEFKKKLLFNLICSTAVKKTEKDFFRIYCENGVLEYAPTTPNIITRLISPQKNPLHLQINDFIESILNRRQPLVSLDDAVASLKTVKQCEKSFTGDSFD